MKSMRATNRKSRFRGRSRCNERKRGERGGGGGRRRRRPRRQREREEENTERREKRRGPGPKEKRPCSAVLRPTLILRGLGPTTPWDASSPSAPVGGSASFNISRRPPLVQRFLFVARVPLHGLSLPAGTALAVGHFR